MFRWLKNKFKRRPAVVKSIAEIDAPIKSLQLDDQSDSWINDATSVCAAAARGDLEARLLNIAPDSKGCELMHSINHLLDMTDAFVREATASLHHAAQGKFFRRVLLNGMLGTFRTAADSINKATTLMDEKTRDLAAAEKRRQQLESDFQLALDRVAGLEAALGKIDHVLHTIHSISMQSNLLALNSAIESARVGALGEGFAVVSGEVRALSIKTADATRDIQSQVEQIRTASKGTADSINHIWKTIRNSAAA